MHVVRASCRARAAYYAAACALAPHLEAKNAVYKFACEAVMNLMRAEVLAVVGTTKTDLRASLADENIEIETLFDPTLGITEVETRRRGSSPEGDSAAFRSATR